ncbi:MAG: ABC transporter permease [Bacteroidetes bacterium]|nr:ABC transporter permease [Bacteroidota bacterium]
MLKNYLLSSWRSLLKTKSFSYLNIIGLSIGIACAGLIFLWAEDEYCFDHNNLKIDRIHQIRVAATYADNTFANPSTPRAMAAALKAEIPGIAHAARISDESRKALFAIDDRRIYASGCYADPEILDILTLPFLQGNASSAFGKLYSIVLTESTAKKFFGEEKELIGRTIRMNNEQNFTVSGILKDLPENSTLQFEWLIPYQVSIIQSEARWGSSDANRWDSYGPYTLVELSPSANTKTIDRQLYDFIHRKDASQNTHPFLFPMTDWRLHDEFADGRPTGGGRISQVRLLSVIAWLILFIACINFMNLTTARSERRAKEVGVRKVLGAGKYSLIAQFYGEALLLSLLSALGAILLIILTLPAFNLLVQKSLSLSPTHLLPLLSIALICAAVAGSYPALYLSSFRPVAVLKGQKLKTGGAALFRKSLVVLQFTVSIVFIISTIVVYRQLQYAQHRDLGFNKERLIEIDMQHSVTGQFTRIRQDLLNTGMIENAALVSHTIITGGDTKDSYTWEGKSADDKTAFAYRNVSSEFVRTAGMRLIDGRDFSGPSDSSSVLITRSLAQLMGEGSPVGKIIRSTNKDAKDYNQLFTVAGVLEDYVYGNVYGQPGPVIFFCKPPVWSNLLYVRLNPQRQPQQALPRLASVLKNDNPDYPFQYKFVDDQFRRLFGNEIWLGQLSTLFAVLAIIISCLGLFGLSAYTAERRTKEMAIRKVLGSSVTRLTVLLSKEFFQLIGLSCLISFPLAGWLMYSWLQHYTYRIAIGPGLFLSAAAIVGCIAALTISFQAIKTARANPIKSLRTE